MRRAIRLLVMKWIALLALPAMAGCVTETLHAAGPHVLMDHEAELVATPSARIDVVEGGTTDVASDTPLHVAIPHAETRFDKTFCLHVPKLPIAACLGSEKTENLLDTSRDVTVRELVTGCRAGDCLAKQIRDEPIELGRRTRISPEAVARIIGATAVAGLSGYCYVNCENRGATFGLVGLVIVVGLLYQPLSLLR